MPNHPTRLLRLPQINMHPRHLVPGKRAHGLKLCVALESRKGFFQAAQAHQHQAQAIPGAVHLFFELDGHTKLTLGIGQLPQRLHDKGQVEMGIGTLGLEFGHPLVQA